MLSSYRNQSVDLLFKSTKQIKSIGFYMMRTLVVKRLNSYAKLKGNHSKFKPLLGSFECFIGH